MSHRKTQISKAQRAIYITQALVLVALAATVATTAALYRNPGHDVVIDPSRPYSAEAVRAAASESRELPSTLWASPATWIVVALAAVWIVTIIAHASNRPGSEWGTPSFGIGVAFGVITGIGALIIGPTSEGSTDNTFATWAQQRYGIEIEDYPRGGGGPLSVLTGDEGGMDTDAVITLDDGQTVKMQQIVEARGDAAFVVAPAEGSSDELPVLVG
ncbi:hypothetical protein [Brachybacterium paraconglomeratum]|uniref:hypothetical protein n=1 Tax=Brachybacterium paraconglomeratum TaxID=173362 RepID=UPI0022AFBC30|nr:hypothetical protein [Brachybacterium paraconglomeratum]MCZ4326769.1 hypothetical protein [Brachybacterium paraconglomeratum]